MRGAPPRLANVNQSDSNRGQPFAGHVDWAAVLAALDDAGYDGDLALECRLRGEALRIDQSSYGKLVKSS